MTTDASFSSAGHEADTSAARAWQRGLLWLGAPLCLIGLWLLALLFFVGLVPAVTTTLLGMAALALRSLPDRRAPVSPQLACGLVLIGGTLGWLLPSPIWSLAPWLTDVLQAVPQVIAGAAGVALVVAGNLKWGQIPTEGAR